MEAAATIMDPVIENELETILRADEEDNHSAWEMQPDGSYLRRHPAEGDTCRSVHQISIERAAALGHTGR